MTPDFIPAVLRIKPDALDRLGIYLHREKWQRVLLLWGDGLANLFGERTYAALQGAGIEYSVSETPLPLEASQLAEWAFRMSRKIDALVAIGGGQVLDQGKFIAHLTKLPLAAIPTVISNDGVCSPFSSLQADGIKRTVHSALPRLVVIDTLITRNAPERFFFSGMGDLASKWTALHDWKAAFRKNGEAVQDFAAQLSINAATAALFSPCVDRLDLEMQRTVATSAVLCGLAMALAGSSRPASGAEHLISHAYDSLGEAHSLHGLQVGVASLLMAKVQEQPLERVRGALQHSGFLDFVRENARLDRRRFLAAIGQAPQMKPGFYTTLSEPSSQEKALRLANDDPEIACLLTE